MLRNRLALVATVGLIGGALVMGGCGSSGSTRPTASWPTTGEPTSNGGTVHIIDYGTTDEKGRVPEFEAIAGWAETEFGWDHNLIAW